ncbi:MAG: 30S ribosomal protein S16 [Candidatus Paceibacterota bacterium]
MLKIRLQRVGRRNNPAFRVIAGDSRRGTKSARYSELLGSYNPHTNEAILKKDRILHWLGQGAQVSGTAHNLFVREGIVDGKKINVLPQKTPVKKEEEEKAETKIEQKPEKKADEASSEEMNEGVEEGEKKEASPEPLPEGASQEESPEEKKEEGEEEKKTA